MRRGRGASGRGGVRVDHVGERCEQRGTGGIKIKDVMEMLNRRGENKRRGESVGVGRNIPS